MLFVPENRPPSHPGEMFNKEFLTPLGITQRDFARRLRVSYPRLNELIHGRRGMTPDTALRLERLLGVEAQFWLNLQLVWDCITYAIRHSRRRFNGLSACLNSDGRRELKMGTVVVLCLWP